MDGWERRGAYGGKKRESKIGAPMGRFAAFRESWRREWGSIMRIAETAGWGDGTSVLEPRTVDRQWRPCDSVLRGQAGEMAKGVLRRAILVRSSSVWSVVLTARCARKSVRESQERAEKNDLSPISPISRFLWISLLPVQFDMSCWGGFGTHCGSPGGESLFRCSLLLSPRCPYPARD